MTVWNQGETDGDAHSTYRMDAAGPEKARNAPMSAWWQTVGAVLCVALAGLAAYIAHPTPSAVAPIHMAAR